MKQTEHEINMQTGQAEGAVRQGRKKRISVEHANEETGGQTVQTEGKTRQSMK